MLILAVLCALAVKAWTDFLITCRCGNWIQNTLRKINSEL